MSNPKTPAQNRKIWATAAQLGLREEELRDRVEALTGARSISGLTFDQAQAVIRELEGTISERRRQHLRVGPPSLRISQGQLNYIYDLVGQSRFSDLWAFRAWLKRYFKVGHEQWLNNKNAGKVITALKSMCDPTRRRTDAASEHIPDGAGHHGDQDPAPPCLASHPAGESAGV